jgi:hypothetical protein
MVRIGGIAAAPASPVNAICTPSRSAQLFVHDRVVVPVAAVLVVTFDAVMAFDDVAPAAALNAVRSKVNVLSTDPPDGADPVALCIPPAAITSPSVVAGDSPVGGTDAALDPVMVNPVPVLSKVPAISATTIADGEALVGANVVVAESPATTSRVHT